MVLSTLTTLSSSNPSKGLYMAILLISNSPSSDCIIDSIIFSDIHRWSKSKHSYKTHKKQSPMKIRLNLIPTITKGRKHRKFSKTHCTLSQSKLNNPIRIHNPVVRIGLDSLQPNVIRRIGGFRQRNRTRGDSNSSDRVPAGKEIRPWRSSW